MCLKTWQKLTIEEQNIIFENMKKLYLKGELKNGKIL